MLVNNAGANLPGGTSEYEPDVFEESVRINLFGAYRMARACREKLAQSALDGGASVVNLASMASFFGITAVPGYGAAKAGDRAADEDARRGVGEGRHPRQRGRARA